jgi:hypothetical protein
MPSKGKKSPKKGNATKTVKELKLDCRGRPVKPPKGKSCTTMLKKELVDFLDALDAGVSSSRSPSPSPSPPKKPSKKATKLKFVCDTDPCSDDEVCILGSGKCVKKTKTGKKTPLLADLKKAGIDSKAYKSDYEFDSDLGVLGLKDHVDEYRKAMKKTKKVKSPKPKKVKTPSPPKPKKATKASSKSKCYDSDADDCDSGKICSQASGKCIADTKIARKGKYILTLNNGREIIGAKDKLEALRKSLGGEGTIASAEGAPAAKPAKKPKFIPLMLSPEEPSSSEEDDDSSAERRTAAEKRAAEKKAEEKRAAAKAKAEALIAAEVEKEKRRIMKIVEESKSGKKPVSPVVTSILAERPTTVDLKKQEIQETFKKCLARLD